MFKSKKANIVLALLIAISLWAYVTGSVNPEVSKKFINVPIKIINESSLTANGLAIDSVENDYVDITVRGTRSHIKDLEESDVRVTADMYNRYSGNNYVPLEVNLPKGVELESKSLEKINIVVGEMESREFKIGVDTENTIASGMTLGKTEIDPDTTLVYGTRKNLDMVDRVVARLDVSQLSEEDEVYRCDVDIINKNGAEVEFLSAENDNVTVTSKLVMVKKVPIRVNVVGTPADGFEVGQIEHPDKVTITGRSEEIEDIEEIKAEDIDISDLKETKTFPLEFKVPEGVKISSEKSLAVKVYIDAPQEESFVISPDDISVENLGDELSAKVTDQVRVIIKGKEEIVESLQAENIFVTVDANGLEPGEHQLKLKVSLQNVTDMDKITIETDKADIGVVITQ